MCTQHCGRYLRLWLVTCENAASARLISSASPRVAPSILYVGTSRCFATTIGKIQRDSVSPVLFTGYLEAALRHLRSRFPARRPADRSFLDKTGSRIACLVEWPLASNASKTERTSNIRHAERIHEEWCMTHKLGSLLGEADDVARRKQQANVAFRGQCGSGDDRLQLRLRRFAAFVVLVLSYKIGTLGITNTELHRLGAYHRRHLRQIVSIYWPLRISNEAPFLRCRCCPIRETVVAARWSLFGHVLRKQLDAPALPDTLPLSRRRSTRTPPGNMVRLGRTYRTIRHNILVELTF